MYESHFRPFRSRISSNANVLISVNDVEVEVIEIVRKTGAST